MHEWSEHKSVNDKIFLSRWNLHETRYTQVAPKRVMFEINRYFADILQVSHEVVESSLCIDECKFSVFDGLEHLGGLVLNLNIC